MAYLKELGCSAPISDNNTRKGKRDVELVSPSLEEIRVEWARKIVMRFNNIGRIALHYEVLIHPVGDGIIFQFPKTRDLTDVNILF